MRCTAIVLGAGLSARMGCAKLLLPFRGKPLLCHTLALVDSLDFSQRILVATRALAESLPPLPTRWTLCINTTPEVGQSASLRIGLSRATGEGFLFFMGDQPLLDAATVAAVLAAAAPGRIVTPTWEGRYGNPVFFAEAFRGELAALTGDVGGRAVRAKHAERAITVQASCAEALWDIDTAQQYRALTGESAGQA